MKTKIFKGGKVILSLILATSMLIASLFTANVGISINAEAAAGTILTWSGTAAAEFASGDGSEETPYMIETPEQLAYLMEHSISSWNGSTSSTAGKFYKVAPNKIFDMGGMSGITLTSTLDEVKAAKVTSKTWNSYKGTNFSGNFDGNGLIVYNLYGVTDAMGLFPSIEGGAVIKNVTVKNSKMISTDNGYGAGAIFGRHNNTVPAAVTIDNCAVVNCDLQNTKNGQVGLIGGAQNWRTINISNCFTVNNSITAATAATLYGGYIPQAAGEGVVLTVADCISIGNSPYTNSTRLGAATYTNVYTDTDNPAYTGSGITTTVSTGADALNAMNLSSTYWLATASTPELLISHSFVDGDSAEDTHTLVCTECGCTGITESHNYVINNKEGTEAICIGCGKITTTPVVTDTWDGTIADSFHSGSGTQADPCIIATAEQLAYAVSGQKSKTESADKYYKIAPCVKSFNMNGKQGITENSTAAQVQDAPVNGDTYNWGKVSVFNWSSEDKIFKGNFDGSGAVIYNIYSYNSFGAGLFGHATSGSNDVVYKNITVASSYFESGWAAGGILGRIEESGQMKIDIQKTVVKNCYIKSNSSDTDKGAAAFVGTLVHNSVSISNCIAYENSISSSSLVGGFAAGKNNAQSFTVSNSISIGIAPYGSSSGISPVITNAYNYSNVYTDQAVDTATYSATQVKQLSATQMKGDTAVDNMDLAWFADWNTVENDYPVPYTPVYNYAYWQGGEDANFTQDANGNYLIETAEQLYAMVKNDGKVNGVAANFKVADGVKELYLSPIKDLVEAGKSTNAIMTVVSSNSNNWNNGISTGWSANEGFEGSFDGNGVTIYGLYASGNYKAGFIPSVKNISAHTVNIKNVNFKYSYVESVSNNPQIATVVGQIGCSNDSEFKSSNVGTELNLEKISVTDTKIAVKGSPSALGSRAGLVGNAIWGKINVKSCFVRNVSATNVGTSAALDAPGWICSANATDTTSTDNIRNTTLATITDSIEINTTGANVWHAKVSNSYSTYGGSAYTITDDETVKGAAAKATMPNLNWSTVWFAANDSDANGMYPQFRYMHNFTLSSQGKSGHTETCGDCGIVGAIVAPHTFIDEAATDMSTCECGYQTQKITVWNGTTAAEFAGGSGTKDDPFIIKTAEQLHKMVRDGGVNSEGKPAYYQVAKGVTELYLNDTRPYETANDFAANSGSLKNWSGDLSDYSQSFDGYFDGNGVTIYGLYSEIANAGSNFYPGVGFVPSLAFDATIKNVIFDTSYVKSNVGYAAVITASTGNAPWSSSEKQSKTANITLMNIAVKNAVVIAGAPVDDGDSGNGSAAGILATRDANLKGLKIINCLFDGRGSTLTANGGSGVTRGIYAASSYGDKTKHFIGSCLSIGYDVYKINGSNSGITITASYTTVTPEVSAVNQVNDYTQKENLPLLNWSQWSYVSGYDAPMPLVNNSWDIARADYYENAVITEEKYAYNMDGSGSITTDYSNVINMGGYVGIDKYENGEFSAWNTLKGSGTEADPYVINDALTLYKIIAAGGCNLGVPQHFVLGSDLDLGSVQWVVMASYVNSTGTVQYKYTPFAGVLDGAGHTVTGLYTNTTETYAGFIPQLNGGTVKNLHIRNSYVNGTNCGIIVGGYSDVIGTVEGCSVENCDGTTTIANGATIKNSYINDSYYNANGDVVAASAITADYTGNSNNSVWYKGGAETCTPKLVNRADAMPYADIDGDGEGYEYTTNDLTALKQKLLRKATYVNVYGDASRNGITDMRDMVSLRREKIAESDSNEWTALDGFWRNLKNGKFEIHYTDTDNYDFARKLELYFAEIIGVTVNKHMTAGDNSFDIVLKKDAALEKDNFKVAYDLENAVLTFSGGSFTAVEQAVLNFIENSDPLTNAVYTGEGVLDSYKEFVTVNGTNYYYAWGDEFDKPVDNTVNYSKWVIHNQTVGDIAPSDATYAQYEAGKIGTFTAARDQHKNLNYVSDGRLELKREVVEEDGILKFYGSGVTTEQSMLFKGGYMEMVATVPSDGYSFPAWWLQTTLGHNNNNISNSLYSKIYELNDAYNGALYYTPTDYQTYKYKLPNHTIEIDIFEVIQKPGITGSYLSAKLNPSSINNLFMGLHKWYSYNYNSADSTLYNLDWNTLPVSGNSFGTYTNANVTDVSTDIKISNKYKTSYDNNTNDYSSEGEIPLRYYYGSDGIVSSNVINKLKYTFLWNESQLVFGCYTIDENGNTVTEKYSKTIDISDLGYDGVAADMNQYAYMMLDNSMWTSSARKLGLNVKKSLSTENLTAEAVSNLLNSFTIDYVRIYQENNKRDIVTAETEAFNSNDRWSAPIYN